MTRGCRTNSECACGTPGRVASVTSRCQPRPRRTIGGRLGPCDVWVTTRRSSISGADESIDPGTPGGSARREYERRERTGTRSARAPQVGRLIHALSDEPQSTKAWDTGASARSARQPPQRAASTPSASCTTADPGQQGEHRPPGRHAHRGLRHRREEVRRSPATQDRGRTPPTTCREVGRRQPRLHEARRRCS